MTYTLYWSPTGQKIGQVAAQTARMATRLAPYPYRKYLGEIYALDEAETQARADRGQRHPGDVLGG